jgi:hypothetical protein
MTTRELDENGKIVGEFQSEFENAIRLEKIRNNYLLALKNVFLILCKFMLYPRTNCADKVLAWGFIFILMFCTFAVTTVVKLSFIFQSAITAIVYFYKILFEHVNHSVKKLKLL